MSNRFREAYNQHMQQHAFVIEVGVEEGIKVAREWVKKELGMSLDNNPDIVVQRYSLLSVEDARKVGEVAAQAPFSGDKKVVIIAASRVYHEAQNALLKIFEEPPQGTYLFLVIPNVGNLLPTLRSRVQILTTPRPGSGRQEISELATQFLAGSKEKRSAIIKKLTTGRDEDERRENRDEALALLHGIETAVYQSKKRDASSIALLTDIATFRGYLQDRSSPVKMILEHLSLVLPKNVL